MSCKSLIDVALTTSSEVLANGTVPLGAITRKRGCNLGLSGNAISIVDDYNNYYLVTVTATFTAPAAGVVTLNLQQNGNTVTGATASTTITTANTEVRSLSFSKYIKTFNGRGIDTLSFVNAGVAVTFSNIDVTVSKA